MSEQPQAPEESISLSDNMIKSVNILSKSRREWIWYARHLEHENTALKERVKELERNYSLIIAYCEVSIDALKGFEGDQSEYDGMYQAMSDLLEKINGEMPWPDLAIERLKQ